MLEEIWWQGSSTRPTRDRDPSGQLPAEDSPLVLSEKLPAKLAKKKEKKGQYLSIWQISLSIGRFQDNFELERRMMAIVGSRR